MFRKLMGKMIVLSIKGRKMFLKMMRKDVSQNYTPIKIGTDDIMNKFLKIMKK